MDNDQMSLSQLRELTGVEPRTLRSWIQQGLVPGPDSRGRNAGYPKSAVTRARAVRYLRDRGLSLDEIRRELTLAADDKIESYAERAERVAEPSPDAAPTPGGSTAADFLRGLRQGGVYGSAAAGETAAGARQSTRPPIGAQSSTRLGRVVQRLEQVSGGRTSQRRIRSEKRNHFEITPDIELIVRGDLTDEDIKQFEDFSQVLKDMLTGGNDND